MTRDPANDIPFSARSAAKARLVMLLNNGVTQPPEASAYVDMASLIHSPVEVIGVESPAMIIVDVGPEFGLFRCMWFDAQKMVRTEIFPLKILRLVRP